MSKQINQYPHPHHIETADRLTLCRWYRFLKSPENPWEQERMDRIVERWNHVGGFTPAISKALGW